jgi:hypothetical protein
MYQSKHLNKLSTIPESFGQEFQVWSPRRVFGRVVDIYPEKATAALLRTADVQTLFGVCEWTVRRWVRRGLPVTRVKTKVGTGERFQFSIKDLSDWLLSGGVKKFRETRHTPWTAEEIEALGRGELPEGRSRWACKMKRWRLRQPNEGRRPAIKQEPRSAPSPTGDSQ